MTIRHLKLFIEVYKEMNITKAADNLYMTQPTVSRAIQELEEHYNVKLFDRINKRISATESGHRLYALALKTVEAFEHMEQEMHNENRKEVIRIGATNSIGSVFLPKLITMYKTEYPEVIVKSVISNGEQIQKLLLKNQVDFALLEGFIPSEQVYYDVFSEDKLVLLLPNDDPRAKKKSIALEELKNDNFLLREKGSIGRNYVDTLFSSYGLPIEPIMESSSTHTIVQAVHAGIGIAILPERLVSHSITSGFVSSCDLKGINFVRQNYIVRHEGKYITNKMRRLMDLCKELAADEKEVI